MSKTQTEPEEPQFSELEMGDENIADLQKWVDDQEMVALVDESCAGIIGYINRAHSERIIAILNGQ